MFWIFLLHFKVFVENHIPQVVKTDISMFIGQGQIYLTLLSNRHDGIGVFVFKINEKKKKKKAFSNLIDNIADKQFIHFDRFIFLFISIKSMNIVLLGIVWCYENKQLLTWLKRFRPSTDKVKILSIDNVFNWDTDKPRS